MSQAPSKLHLSFLTAAACGAALLAGLLPAPAARAQLDLVAAGGVYGVKVTSWRDIPFRTVVRQKYDYSCGSAALATLLRYQYGFDIDEAAIFKSMWAAGDKKKIQKVGFSLLDMKEYLDREDLDSDGYKLNYDELATIKDPSIAVISVGSYRHFVVIKGITVKKVLIGDPALGIRDYSRADFLKVWDGVVFLVHDRKGMKGKFNLASDWQPWSKAPVGTVLTPGELSFERDLVSPEIFQVVQTQPVVGP
ncbi:MAG: C39 family peptidase [Caulobacteraceae bacterium]